MKNEKLKKGFTLVEIMIGTALLCLVFLGLYNGFILALKISSQGKAQATAIAIANEKIEEIRSMSYNSIGTLGGIPTGNIPQTQTISRNNINFTVKVVVIYIDDPFDSYAPTDSLSADYKRVKVRVLWNSWLGGDFALVTDIAPKGVETITGGGTLKLKVFNANGTGVSQANIRLINDSTFPNIDVNYLTDNDGNLIVAGAPASIDSYRVLVSKDSYSQERTYSSAEIASPAKLDLSVFEGQVTESSFAIDQLSSLVITTYGRDSFDDDFGNDDKIISPINIQINSGEVALVWNGAEYSVPGSFESIAIDPPTLLNWDSFVFNDLQPSETFIRYFILFADSDGNFIPIPDADLPENSTGFNISPVDLSSLNVSKYKSLRIMAVLNTIDRNKTPKIFDWHFIYNTPAIGNVNFNIKGAKILGQNSSGESVYKFSQLCESNGSGIYNLNNLEWDSYDFQDTSATGMNLVEARPSLPFNLLPNITANVDLYFKAQNTLLVEVIDSETSLPVFGASVSLTNAVKGYYSLMPTDANGEAFFIPLESAQYDLKVEMSGYQTNDSVINVLGNVNKQINVEK